MLLKVLYWVLNYAAGHATAKVYSSPVPIGKRLGGHDVTQVANLFLIVDFRVDDRIVLLGYFQFS